MFVRLKTFTIATCPYCLSAHVRRSHRHFYEKPLSLLGIRPLRCLRCYTRSWKFLSSNRLRFQKSPRIPPAFPKTRAVTLSGAMALALTALLIGTSLTLLFAALLRSIQHSPKLINAHSVEQRLYSLQCVIIVFEARTIAKRRELRLGRTNKANGKMWAIH